MKVSHVHRTTFTSVKAMQFTGRNGRMFRALMDAGHSCRTIDAVLTIDGNGHQVMAKVGDWVVRGRNGDWAVYRPEDFAARYREMV